MPKIAPSSLYLKNFLRLVNQNPKLLSKISKTLHLFESDPKHPSLRLHKLGNSHRWSISATISLRITFEYYKDQILLINIGTHDEVYK